MKRKHGLLDFFITVVACAAVYTQTPIGALIDRPIEWIFGVDRPDRPLTGFFDLGAAHQSAEPTDRELARLAAARRQRDPNVQALAARFGVRESLLQALSLTTGPTGLALSTLQLKRAEAIAGEETLPSESRARHNLAAGLLLEYDARRLGSLDAALGAFLLGDKPVQRAVNLARERERGDPTLLSVHRRYLSREQRDRVEPFVDQLMAVVTALDIQWPVTGKHRITSPFGNRTHPVLGGTRFHNGVDIAVPIGTSILAAHDARVTRARHDNVNGWYLKLDHGYGLQTAYCHNDSLRVKADDLTIRAATVALSGNTGRSTGPHLHYMVKIGGRAVDPMIFKDEDPAATTTR